MSVVSIGGPGVLAYTCVHLLREAGFGVRLEETGRAKLPAILIGEATQSLMGDVYGRRDLFHGLPRIEKRVVAWGEGAEPVTLPHSAVVISEEALSERLRPVCLADGAGEVEWTILASAIGRLPAEEHRFGTRRARALAVELRDGSDPSACSIESLKGGWLFLIPTGGQTGWALAVGAAPESLLAESRLVAPQIRSSRSGPEFPAYPRVSDPLCGPGWLSGGTAALAFDPLCGDGTGHAVREAILAAAVIRAAAKGENVEHLRAHYRARLLAGFQRHLEVCRQFYMRGGSGEWWEGELERIRQGIDWCAAQLSGTPFRFRLEGFDLVPLG